MSHHCFSYFSLYSHILTPFKHLSLVGAGVGAGMGRGVGAGTGVGRGGAPPEHQGRSFGWQRPAEESHSQSICAYRQSLYACRLSQPGM